MIFRQRWRGACSFVGLGVKAAPAELDSLTPQITSGAGVPSANLPNGSRYMQTDAAGAAAALHMVIGSVWVPLDGS